MRHRIVAWILGLLAFGAALSTLRAQQPEPDAEARRELAKQLFLQANEQARQGSLGDAIALFERAVKLAPEVGAIHRNLATALKQVGRCPEAIVHFQRYLELRSDAPDRATIEDELRICRERAGSTGNVVTPEVKKDAALTITCNVEGALVRVDGVNMGQTPLHPMVLKPNTYNISVEKAGYDLWQRRLPIEAGRDLIIEVTLQKASGSGTPKPVVGGPAPRRPHVAAWSTIGTGGGLLIGGAILTLVSALDESKFDDAKRTTANGETRIEMSQKRAKQLQDRINGERLAAYVLYGVGAAAVGTGIVLYFVLDRAPATSSQTVVPVSATPVPGGALFSYGGQF